MPSKINVFVSSTMKDLVNERDLVVRKIADFNFMPVNAEGWLPTGSGIWERIQREILSSHLFVLICGERYGYIPEEGPGAAEGLSVTHMETNVARAARIPILPFLKNLDYDSNRDSEDATKRDAFRQEISRWSSGYPMADFKLASELSEKVGAALVSALSESYLNAQVQERSALALSIPGETIDQVRPDLVLDPLLIDLVRRREAILLAGAGMSLRAGFPSARAMTELVIYQVRQQGDDFSRVALSGSFQEVAENFELAYGRKALLEIILKALSAPQGIEPTSAHRLSLRLFDRILTTNFDRLFELTCEQEGIEYETIFDDVEIPAEPHKTLIIKIDGSISAPESLVITTRDALDMRRAKPRLWESLASLVSATPLVIVGHSLRDLNTRELLRHRPAHVPCYVVAPDIGSFDERRLARRGFRSVKSDADTFFRQMAAEVGLDE